MKVAFVDGYESVREVVAEVLKALSHDVELFDNPADAFKACSKAETPYDVLVLENELLGNSLRHLEELCKLGKKRPCIVLVLNHPNEEIRHGQAWYDGSLCKPFGLTQLRDVIVKVCTVPVTANAS